MSKELLLWVLVQSIIMILCLIWVYFFDWLKIIGCIISIISPNKKIKEIEENQKLRQNPEFKKHQKKWKLRFLITLPSFVSLYLLIFYISQDLLISYFSGLLVIVLIYGILSKFEAKERKRLCQQIKQEE